MNNLLLSDFLSIFASKYWLIVVNGACEKQESLSAECWYDFRWLIIASAIYSEYRET